MITIFNRESRGYCTCISQSTLGASSVSFEALSYVCGDLSFTKAVVVVDIEVEVRENFIMVCIVAHTGV